MGAWAILIAMLCFIAPMAVPLAAQTWRSFLIIVLIGAAFAAWMTVEEPKPGSVPNLLGSFLAGLIVIGFAFGATARFVMLIGKRKPGSETDSTGS